MRQFNNLQRPLRVRMDARRCIVPKRMLYLVLRLRPKPIFFASWDLATA